MKRSLHTHAGMWGLTQGQRKGTMAVAVPKSCPLLYPLNLCMEPGFQTGSLKAQLTKML